MGSQQPPLAALYLLGVLVTSCLGGPNLENSGFQVRLTSSNSHCQGQLEVSFKKNEPWHTVSSRSWGKNPNHWEDPKQASNLCRLLSCGKAVAFAHFPDFNSPKNQITCHGLVGSFSNCSFSNANQRDPLGLICLEPPRTAPPPTTPPPTTTPQPTAPPRLQLVAGPGGLRCAGVVEFYWGSRGGAISYEAQDKTQDLENRICEALQCGSFLKHLPEEDTARAQDPEESRPLPIRWKIQNTSCASLEQCFSKVQPREGGQALAIVCSDFQPKVQSRLVGRRSLCEGSVEEKLSQCYQLQEKKAYCRRVFVTCHDPNPAGPGAGTVMSIILGLVLLAVLLVVCGPHAYRKLVKKFRQKKQRQWIGPTGMNQNMSFHRNHTATVRSQVENPTVSHVENEYSHPPRNSHISACPALEGALHRVSTQPDNSSDSDYDLHGAQRL
ncbi:T-cell surface glycoprotein CD5 isoform X2 [Panthera pardus]|uniref:T-cell surface glycoprotein CD5 isoform X2 n=1 Tax=Panthera pardus TaxID=9691 RepID=A0A9W2VAM8_PANPR|nr:T-cell surface glycoprotein CD5 isoform X2 [Panthera pardus]